MRLKKKSNNVPYNQNSITEAKKTEITMKAYKHILLALELVQDSDKLIIEKARQLLSNDANATLTLIHSVENYPNLGTTYATLGGISIDEELLLNAKKALADVAKELNVPANHQIVELGSAKHLIVDKAKEIGADLIVVGS